jgi:hypothetical protein
VVRRSFPLTEMTTPDGFEEGAALLERQPGPYVDDVVASVKQVLVTNQIDVWAGFSVDADGSNPLRISPPMAVAGAPVPSEQVDRVLYPLEVEIWAFAEKLGDSRDEFWIDADV